jgi:hypothetical protein
MFKPLGLLFKLLLQLTLSLAFNGSESVLLHGLQLLISQLWPCVYSNLLLPIIKHLEVLLLLFGSLLCLGLFDVELFSWLHRVWLITLRNCRLGYLKEQLLLAFVNCS